MNAMLKIEEYLLDYGLSEDEVEELICLFLEQEAYTYVKCIEEYGGNDTKTKILHKKTRDA